MNRATTHRARTEQLKRKVGQTREQRAKCAYIRNLGRDRAREHETKMIARGWLPFYCVTGNGNEAISVIKKLGLEYADAITNTGTVDLYQVWVPKNLHGLIVDFHRHGFGDLTLETYLTKIFK